MGNFQFQLKINFWFLVKKKFHFRSEDCSGSSLRELRENNLWVKGLQKKLRWKKVIRFTGLFIKGGYKIFCVYLRPTILNLNRVEQIPYPTTRKIQIIRFNQFILFAIINFSQFLKIKSTQRLRNLKNLNYAVQKNLNSVKDRHVCLPVNFLKGVSLRILPVLVPKIRFFLNKLSFLVFFCFRLRFDLSGLGFVGKIRISSRGTCHISCRSNL